MTWDEGNGELVQGMKQEKDTAEAEAFLERAREQAAQASTPANNSWILLLVAGGVFAIGMLLRSRIHKT